MSSGKKKTIGPRDGIGGGYVACKCSSNVHGAGLDCCTDYLD